MEKLASAERKFAESMPPIEVLRAWMLLFVDHIATKQIIGPALNTFVGGPSKLYEGSRSQIHGAIDALVKRAIKSGNIRKDLDPFDLIRALIGVSNVASSGDSQQSAKRLVRKQGGAKHRALDADWEMGSRSLPVFRPRSVVPGILRVTLHAWTSSRRLSVGSALMDFPTFSWASRRS